MSRAAELRSMPAMNLFQRLFVPFHVLVYRLSGGRLLGRLGGLPVLLLTTTGRRSGKRRTMPLLHLEEDGALVVVASAAGAPRNRRGTATSSPMRPSGMTGAGDPAKVTEGGPPRSG